MVDGCYEVHSYKPGHKKMSTSWGCEFIGIVIPQNDISKGKSYLLSFVKI